jgi:hypothetical protein
MSNSSSFHEEGQQDNRDRRRRRNPRGENDDDDTDEDTDEKRRIFSPDNRFRLTPTTFAPSKYVVKVRGSQFSTMIKQYSVVHWM